MNPNWTSAAAILLATALVFSAVPCTASSSAWQAGHPSGCLEHPATAIGNYTAPQYDK